MLEEAYNTKFWIPNLAELTLPSNVENTILILEILAREKPLTAAMLILINAHLNHMTCLVSN